MRNKRWYCLLFLPLLALIGAYDNVVPASATQPVAYVALTFDDGPSGKTTERLLDALGERNAHATFFIIGEQVEGQETLLRRMADEGHQIGNHTYSHCRLDNTGAVGKRELERTEEKLRSILGGNEYWVRPPWGFASAETLRETGAPLIYWTLDTEDWKLLDADRVAERIVKNVRDGDIVLLHDSYATSVDAAIQAIDALSVKGFAFVTLEELFLRMGVEPMRGCLYCRPDLLRTVE